MWQSSVAVYCHILHVMLFYMHTHIHAHAHTNMHPQAQGFSFSYSCGTFDYWAPEIVRHDLCSKGLYLSPPTPLPPSCYLYVVVSVPLCAFLFATCTHPYINTHIHTHMHMHVHANIRAYTHAQTHTNKHTRITVYINTYRQTDRWILCVFAALYTHTHLHLGC